MLDEWLTEMLGYPVYNSMLPPKSGERSLTWLRVPVTSDVHAYLDRGFQIVDVHGWFESRGRFPESPHGPILVQLPPSEYPEHHGALLDIASSCFAHSRFRRDELTRPHASRIKREWLRNCLEGRRGSEVLVAVGLEGPTGFLAVSHDGGGSRIVDLIGVDPFFQGLGVGRGLLTEFGRLNEGRTLGAGTSLDNAAAVRLYQSCGFRLCSSSYVLHLHRGVQ